MKVYLVVDDGTGDVVGITEEKIAAKLFISQYGDEGNFRITKIKGRKAEDLFQRYADTKGIAFIGRRDIVAVGRHADMIFETLSEKRREFKSMSDELQNISTLNITESESKVLIAASKILKQLSEDDIKLEDALKDEIIFYLSSASNNIVKERAFLRGEDY